MRPVATKIRPISKHRSREKDTKSRAILILHLIGQGLNSFIVIGLSMLASSQKCTYKTDRL